MGSFIYSRCGGAPGVLAPARTKGWKGQRIKSRVYICDSAEKVEEVGRENVKADFYEAERTTGLGNVQPWRHIKHTNDRFIDFQFSMSRDVTNGDSMSGANVT